MNGLTWGTDQMRLYRNDAQKWVFRCPHGEEVEVPKLVFDYLAGHYFAELRDAGNALVETGTVAGSSLDDANYDIEVRRWHDAIRRWQELVEEASA